MIWRLLTSNPYGLCGCSIDISKTIVSGKLKFNQLILKLERIWLIRKIMQQVVWEKRLEMGRISCSGLTHGSKKEDLLSCWIQLFPSRQEHKPAKCVILFKMVHGPSPFHPGLLCGNSLKVSVYQLNLISGTGQPQTR